MASTMMISTLRLKTKIHAEALMTTTTSRRGKAEEERRRIVKAKLCLHVVQFLFELGLFITVSDREVIGHLRAKGPWARIYIDLLDCLCVRRLHCSLLYKFAWRSLMTEPLPPMISLPPHPCHLSIDPSSWATLCSKIIFLWTPHIPPSLSWIPTSPTAFGFLGLLYSRHQLTLLCSW